MLLNFRHIQKKTGPDFQKRQVAKVTKSGRLSQWHSVFCPRVKGYLTICGKLAPAIHNTAPQIWVSTSVQMMILLLDRQNRQSASSMTNTPPAETR